MNYALIASAHIKHIEPAIATLNSIIDYYDKVMAIKSYIHRANNGNGDLGPNEKLLFKGIKTIRGYENRYNKHIELSESNENLLRIIPLCELNKNAIYTDCCITNPHFLNLWMSDIYYELYNCDDDWYIKRDMLYSMLTTNYVENLQESLIDYEFEYMTDEYISVILNMFDYVFEYGEIDVVGDNDVIRPILKICKILNFDEKPYSDYNLDCPIVSGLLGKWIGPEILNYVNPEEIKNKNTQTHYLYDISNHPMWDN